ncbi:hypothetical protein COM23_28570 [Bacillus wiedmannii]|uniref:hypothetical protein n=1 Tax=Bacillus cereus group TaxID=86661 RepID=UPI0008FDB9D9|nr:MULTISPECIES: hypothetical protein [Bacillus cereus group]MCM3201708.1 hypothetical protein [Bacillus cereus]MDN4100245.1 hypothetical protein [Bacillus cereus]OJE15121.1 hypothetical protein A9488_08370 [Bacillus cereus]PGC18040.1 hypothetical protein COM23_28570 [Bacillus wiedmannii]UDW03865.1 hypothetical protein FHQ13_027875 [Bacillus cereus]
MTSIQVDGSGQKYVEIETVANKESLRISFIKDGFTNEPCLRINIRPHGMRLRQGPEFSLNKLPEIQAALTELLLDLQNEK